MTSTFFGLPSNHSLTVHKDIFTLMHYGRGWTWDVVYDMPIFLRLYYMKLLSEVLEAEKKISNKSPRTLTRPNI